MFERECDTLARLKHPNIASIYEAGRTPDGQHFFAMELVRGETLDEYLSTRPDTLSTPELKLRLRLLRKIADAVHYAHLRGVIHRDLKPSNIIVASATAEHGDSSTAPDSPEIKILDCTIRDGGLTNSHRFEDGFVRAVYEALVDAGVDYMEMGYKASKDQFSKSDFGPWKFCDEEDLRRVLGDDPKVKLSIMAACPHCCPNSR